MVDKEAKSDIKKNVKNRITVAVIFILLFCTVVVLNMKWDKLSPDNLSNTIIQTSTAKEEFSDKISGTSVQEKNIIDTGVGVYYISDTSIIQLDYNGDKKFSAQHSYTNPVIKCSGNYAIAFGLGSEKYRVISPSYNVYNGTQGSSIIDCDINTKGTYCVMSDHKGYLSVITIYDSNNEFVYSYSFNNCYGLSCTINEKGTMAVVGTVNTIDGAMMTKVYLLDFSSDTPKAVLEYKDDIIYEVKFINDNSVAVVTDSALSVLDTSSSKSVTYSYDSKFLASYDLSYNGDIVLALSQSDDSRNCRIVILDQNGKEINSFITDCIIYSIDYKNDKIAILSDNTLYKYDTFGTCLGNWQIGHDAKNIVIINDKTSYILGVSELRKIIIEN